jgi:hypothetical protein
MGATAYVANATLESVLKEFYVKAIAEQLNQEVLALEMFEKAKLDWSGKRVVVPVHISRNSGVGFTTEGGTLPAAGNQGFKDLGITAKFLYGRFQITGPAISAAKGAYSFGNYIDLELRKLVEDVRKKANLATLHGASTKGYVTFSNTIATGANRDVDYYGNIQQIKDIFDAVAAGDVLRCKLIRTDTYARINAAPAALNNELEVAGVDVAAHQINLANPAGGVAVDTQRTVAGNAGIIGKPLAVEFFTVTTAGGGGTGAVSSEFENEFTGVVHNISATSHFGVDRSQAANSELRAPGVLTIATGTGAAAYNAPQDLNLARMQTTTDEISAASNLEADVILINPLLRQHYTSLLVGTSAGNVRKQASEVAGGDGGFKVSDLGFNGTPFKTSVDCGRGMMLFLHTKVWKCAQLESPGFADLDGNILARAGIGSGGVDAYEGYYRMYMDVYCERPNANGVLTGIKF